MSFEPMPLNSSLDQVLKGLRGAGTQARSMGSLFSRWAEAVGPVIADHARPVKFDGDHLLVEVDEPAWATQLRFLESDVIERLRSIAGLEVSRFDIRVKRG
jgi:predicted nucleic acid-binding Zn ribbon protein